MLLNTDLSPFMSQYLDSFFYVCTRIFEVLKNTTILHIGNIDITAFDIAIGGIVLEIAFGLFLFVAPRMQGNGV